jgi:hypothetical protein
MLKFLQRGKLITALLRDRGRSRRFLISRIQHKQQARLDAMLVGSIKPRVSAHQCDLPISITSWMPRKDALPLVLLSMIEQSLRPAAVHVWLCAEDQEMIEARLRDFFAVHGVQFHETDNIGPHKKWLPLIESGHEGPFVIADDDTFYPSDWFGALVDEGAERPDEIIAHRCHNMKFDAHHHLRPYADWQKGVTGQKESSHSLFAVGCGGTLIRPAAIAEEFRSRELINKLCHRADDIWLKAAYIHSGYKVRKSSYDFPSMDYPGTTQSGLAVTNVDQGQSDQQLQQVLQYFDLKLAS